MVTGECQSFPPLKRLEMTTIAERCGRMTKAPSERFELPTGGLEIRCSIQLSYEGVIFIGRFTLDEGSPQTLL